MGPITKFSKLIFRWISDLVGDIPLIAWISLICGILVAIGSIYFIKYIAEHKSEEKKKPKELDPYKLPPIGGWISEFLCRKGFFKIGRLSIDFLNSLSFLEDTLKCDNYKYKNPWFLVLGTDSAGKTTLMQSLHTTDASLQSYQETHKNAECNWHFLRGGVGLDISGKLFFDPNTMSADEVGWSALKNLLLRYRSSKPIDSIILAISAEDLYGKNRISSSVCLEHAKFVTHKLLMFQSQLKIRIPIYIVITKTDIIPGFKDFCEHIPTTTKQHMFGWSSPYNIDAAFSVQWVQEALNDVVQQINHISMDIYCSSLSEEPIDSLFVFPYELKKIETNLSIYLNQLFNTDQNKTPLLLRGIYFAGDSSIETEDIANQDFIDEKLLSSNSNNPENTGETETQDSPSEEQKPIERYRSLFFFGDLIYEKIIPEHNLCVPHKGMLVTANRSLQIAKITTGVFIVGGGFGLHTAYQNFIHSRNSLIPAINSMYRFLVMTQQIPTTELSKKNDAFEGAVKQLDTIMQRLDNAQLSSLFVPASWFSPLRSRLGTAINLAYQNVIMRALYVNLILKTRELLQMSPENIETTRSLAQLALPTKSNEFLAMKKFVDGLLTLSDYVEKFNDLRLVPSAKALSNLIEYAFKMTLSESFIKHYKDLKGNLNASIFPAIDLSVYKGHARKTLSTLFQHFFNTIFIYSNPKSFPAQLEQIIRQLRHVDSHGLPDLDFLRTLGLDLDVVLKTFGDDESPTWMDQDVFAPSREFEDFLCSLDKSYFFGAEISQAIVDNCAIGMFHLKHRLKEISKILTTDVRFASQPEEQNSSRPYSTGLIILGKSIKTLFNEPYMRRSTGHQFIENVPEGQTLYWDNKLLQAACELCTQYEEFTTKNVGTFPVILQESFRLLARDGLQKNLMSLIAQAQNFIPLPNNLHNKLVVEELIRSQSANIRQVYPYFLKLLELLNYDSVSFFYVTLRELLLESNYWLLKQINELMKKIGPYHIWDPSFSWWNGKENPAYQAYGVKDSQDLNSFLNMQSQHVINLALNLAKPIVDFLTSDIMLSVNPLDKTLLTKWRRIVDQTDAFQKKQPGNSIATLENFITTTFKNYTIDNVFEQINLADISESAGDHFLETMLFIKKGILGRVEVLVRKRNIQNYKELMNFFNKKLSGRFPFTPSSTDINQGSEADPEEVRTFLKKFEQFGRSSKKILDQIYQIQHISREAETFLQRIEDIYELFKAYLEESDGTLPFITASHTFNVNRDKAVGTSYVAQWSVRTNYDELISHSDKNHQTKWIYGAPTEVIFRWPNVKGILERPLNDPKQPALKVLETTATFTYKGHWSVLRMIRMHRANRGEYIPMVNPNSVVLKFIIPISDTKSAILYNAVSFLGVSQNPNLPGKTLVFPDFPIIAPELPIELEKYRNEPVISSGIIKPVD